MCVLAGAAFSKKGNPHAVGGSECLTHAQARLERAKEASKRVGQSRQDVADRIREIIDVLELTEEELDMDPAGGDSFGWVFDR